MRSQRFVLTIVTLTFLTCNLSLAGDDGYDLWLKYKTIAGQERLNQYRQLISSIYIAGDSATSDAIRVELQKGLNGLLGKEIPISARALKDRALWVGTPQQSHRIEQYTNTSILSTLGTDGFIIKSVPIDGNQVLLISANQDIGLLYGAFHLLRLIQTHTDIEHCDIISKPRIDFRLLNHWDNLDRTVERGYAGQSLWKWDELPTTMDPRYTDYARANASVGINGTVLNNVNANPRILLPENLKKVAALANVFRPFGIRVFLSINFSSPISAEFGIENNRRGGIGDLNTSNPSHPEVQRWWKDKAKEIYAEIPDFGGFLVKANSEGMSGPQEWGKTHADGANLLAEALEPFHGIVMWRAFVYVPDTDPDRAKRAYKEFVPLDGQFHANVFVQGKNGPIDFQPREPVQPLFGAMPKTPLMLELQVTQEYLGHSTQLVYLAPMWKEYLEFDTYAKGEGTTLARIVDGHTHDYKMTGIAGVTNIGDDRNWCGHFFAQSNWYAYGRLAWDHTLSPEQIADEWIRMSLSSDDTVIKTVKNMMLGSWEACINYMTPVGLHHIMQADVHYGPQPSFSQSRPDWTSVYYHRADKKGLGFNRTSTGSDAVSQYFSPLHERFENLDSCPEKYLLWFHHVPWDHKMNSGRTLWNELCFRYHEGIKYVDGMISSWKQLEGAVDSDIHEHVTKRLTKHRRDAGIWRDTCVNYFQGFSGMPLPSLD